MAEENTVLDHDVIDLGIGEPDPAALPLGQLRQAAAHRLSNADTAPLRYGPEEGSASFRAMLAEFLTRCCRVPVHADHLMITAGASHALDLVLSRLCRPGDAVFVEDPTYMFALDIFRDRPVRLVSVRVDEHGLDVDDLERMLAVEAPRLVYTIPVFHNPTGVTLSVQRRRRLMELAVEHDFLVVADEVYQLTGERDATPPPLRTVNGERVLSLGSFSKILGPGIRLGWIEAAPHHVARLRDAGVLHSGGGASPLMAAILESLIDLGFQDRFLGDLWEIYRARRLHLVDVLRGVLPAEVRFTTPQGGYYIWLELPSRIDIMTLSTQAAAYGVGFRPGPLFSRRDEFTSHLRVSFSFYNEERLSLAGERLGALLRSRL
ncbi:hypothetical protein ALI144C_30800 [Actinosynnema sp. ALI-1.44]|nr:hypothetical protein ALI144C_30800 [Actinosynnema sp. ALI-1.44]